MLQVPQYVLEHAIDCSRGTEANILCTQPRRLPAVALAGRVADEMGTPCGAVVGYSVRLNKKMSAATRLLFCTTGILLRRLIADPQLTGVSHVIIDEVHERSLDSDLLMLLLRDTLTTNLALRVVLMSATADSRLFADYLDATLAVAAASPDGAANKTAVVEIPGFTYPVRELALEDVITATGALLGCTLFAGCAAWLHSVCWVRCSAALLLLGAFVVARSARATPCRLSSFCPTVHILLGVRLAGKPLRPPCNNVLPSSSAACPLPAASDNRAEGSHLRRRHQPAGKQGAATARPQ